MVIVRSILKRLGAIGTKLSIVMFVRSALTWTLPAWSTATIRKLQVQSSAAPGVHLSGLTVGGRLVARIVQPLGACSADCVSSRTLARFVSVPPENGTESSLMPSVALLAGAPVKSGTVGSVLSTFTRWG